MSLQAQYGAVVGLVFLASLAIILGAPQALQIACMILLPVAVGLIYLNSHRNGGTHGPGGK